METEAAVKLVKHYPTVDEILNEDRRRTCTDCKREFHNSSACRFHELKQHSMNEMIDTNEARILRRTSTSQLVRRQFYCPEQSCSKKSFDGLRYVRQHYIRSHVEKKLLCEHCGLRLALPKDMNYHKKARCAVLKKQRAIANEGELPDKTQQKRRKESSKQHAEECESTSQCEYSQSPIVLIVAPGNARNVIETIRTALETSELADINVLKKTQPGVFAEAGTQVQMTYHDSMGDDAPIYATASTSTTFATQFNQEPVTFCERGTMMTEEEPLRYFSPPYGAEFGDMAPEQKQQHFDYSSAPSTSQPQTRSFGTMFENVATCNTGTSMIDETFPDFLRDIHTQTPNGITDSSSTAGPSSSNNANWPWTDGI